MNTDYTLECTGDNVHLMYKGRILAWLSLGTDIVFIGSVGEPCQRVSLTKRIAEIEDTAGDKYNIVNKC